MTETINCPYTWVVMIRLSLMFVHIVFTRQKVVFHYVNHTVHAIY